MTSPRSALPLTIPPLLLLSCAFAPGGQADAGRADARDRADGGDVLAFDAAPASDANGQSDAMPNSPDASIPGAPDAAPPVADTILITEIVDADLPGGLPKFVELSNLGTAAVDLSAYSVGIYSNGNTTLAAPSHSLSGSLGVGASFVISFEGGDSPGSGTFFSTYGVDPDDFSFSTAINGNDVIALFRGPATGTGSDAILVDVYGVIGTDGLGEVWDYSDGFATRRPASTTPADVFDSDDWGFSGPDALAGADGPAISAATSPGSH